MWLLIESFSLDRAARFLPRTIRHGATTRDLLLALFSLYSHFRSHTFVSICACVLYLLLLLDRRASIGNVANRPVCLPRMASLLLSRVHTLRYIYIYTHTYVWLLVGIIVGSFIHLLYSGHVLRVGALAFSQSLQSNAIHEGEQTDATAPRSRKMQCSGYPCSDLCLVCIFNKHARAALIYE